MVNRPSDLARIVNIPHPPPDECQHPNNTRVFPLSGFGAWCCLQCGTGGIAKPTHKLEVTASAIWPAVTEPGAVLSLSPSGSFGIVENDGSHVRATTAMECFDGRIVPVAHD